MTSNDRNACLPPTSEKTCPENSSEPSEKDNPKNHICRKFIWGICNKSAQSCLFRHDLDIHEMRRVIKFCHDFQNRGVCTRGNCTFLHATIEEQNLFLTKGQMPQVLAERHMAMAQVETVNPKDIIYGGYTTAPPPPPPPPPPPVASVPRIMQQPPPPPPPVPRIMQQPPPPPPPPPVTTQQIKPQINSAPSSQNTPISPVTQPPPPLQAMFDASMPPPPIPSLKRPKARDISGATPNKIRRADGSSEIICETCIQRQKRIDEYREQKNILQTEEETQTIAYKKKLAEYENEKSVMRSVVSPELYRILEEYLEGAPHMLQVQDLFSQCNQLSAKKGSPMVPRQFATQLLDIAFNMPANTTSSSSRMDETLVQSPQVPRQINSVAHIASTELVNALLEFLTKSTDETVETRLNQVLNLDRSNSSNISNNNNQSNSLKNVSYGQKMVVAQPVSAVKTTSGPVNSVCVHANTTTANSTWSSQGATNSVAVSNSNLNSQPGQAYNSYPAYHPNVPPPPPPKRPPFCRQPYPSTATAPHSYMPRMGVPTAPPVPQPIRPSTSTPIRHPIQTDPNYQYPAGSYPQQYFPYQ